MNRKIILSLLLILSASAQLLARDDGTHAVVLNGREQHSEHYTPADMPEVYYDSDNQQIILVADGIVNYYDVEIVSQSTMLTVISTQADGYGDTIDVSSLPDDDYTIVITSPYNNVYEGHFSNY